ncbi:biopolymer transporter ExbD [Burkholderiaceae bacterium DAT-1]|nr:biopolymer transporter ExbD [Burkholderiaceae bacterium DAT-1]
MSMSVGSDSGDNDSMVSEINTTPLVDVMLVLLIIFLITIPAAELVKKVPLPRETITLNQSKPADINISVDKDGEIYWGIQHVASNDELMDRLKKEAVKVPQPEIHIHGDPNGHYDAVGRVATDCQRMGILKVGFITQPPDRG